MKSPKRITKQITGRTTAQLNLYERQLTHHGNKDHQQDQDIYQLGEKSPNLKMRGGSKLWITQRPLINGSRRS